MSAVHFTASISMIGQVPYKQAHKKKIFNKKRKKKQRDSIERK
jgi:hypothetical protein